jgi:hypothetical protein
MLKKIKTYLKYGTHFCGIEHTIFNGENVIYGTIFIKSKKTVDIESFFNEYSIENTIAKLSKKQHIFLVINDDNILTKRIESEQTELEKLVHNAFPNINLEDFVYEVLTQHNNHFISICRKEYVEELISNYKNFGGFVINISLGNTLASSIVQYIKEETLLSSNANIVLKDNEIISIERREVESIANYDINGLKINSTQVLSSAAALAEILQNFNPRTNFNVLKKSIREDYLQSRFFSQFLKFSLIFILSLLLVNFLVFNHYFNEVHTLQQISQLNQSTKQKIMDLNVHVNKTQKMADDMLKSNSSKSSFYTNSIIQGLPNSILLSELIYQPVIKRIKAGQSIETNINTIIISGESNNREQFSKWIRDLEAIEWIKKVEISNYEDVSKSLSNFNLKINIRDDN